MNYQTLLNLKYYENTQVKTTEVSNTIRKENLCVTLI